MHRYGKLEPPKGHVFFYCNADEDVEGLICW